TMSLQDSKGPSMVKGDSGQQLPAGVTQELINQKQLEAVQKQVQQFIDTEKLDNSTSDKGQTSAKLDEYIELIQQERGLVVSFKDTLLLAAVLMYLIHRP
ncbi:MAG TPA: hypothetical protein VHQ70_08255, partial [Syntrophomonadaceae bacterium]|nr:hypothetical protein [Syntrophomonadaceae bacterium]